MLNKLLGWIFRAQEPVKVYDSHDDPVVTPQKIVNRAYEDAKDRYGEAERRFWHVTVTELEERVDRVKQRIRVHVERSGDANL